MQMKISKEQANRLLEIRNMSGSARKIAKRAIFADIRRKFGIPTSQKMKFFIENPDNPLYCVIRDKFTGNPLDDGKTPDVAVKPVIATSPAAKPAAKKAAKPAAKKTVTKAVPKKAVAKPAAKKAVAKPAAKKAVAKPAAKKAVAKPAAKKVAKKAAK